MVKGPDGFWCTADGKKIELTMVVMSGYTDWVLAAEEVARQLTAFGLSTIVKLTPGELYGPVLAAGEFDFAIEFTIFAKYHPVQGFDRIYKGWLGQRAGVDPKGKGPAGEDLDKLVDELMVTFDPAKQVEIIDKLVWATNKHLPVIEFVEKNAQFFIADGIRATGWPEHQRCPVRPDVWIAGDEMRNMFGWNWRLAHLKWMIEGLLTPVGQ